MDRDPRYANGRIWGVLIPAFTALALITTVAVLAAVFIISNAA